jgi:tyrosyl-tRNA synthetase
VRRKIKKAFCPPNQISENPILEYCKYIIFELVNDFKIERPEKYGGNVSYSTYQQLEKDYADGNLNPPDLKPAVAKYLNQFLEPIRKHFNNDKKANELYLFVKREYQKQKE